MAKRKATGHRAGMGGTISIQSIGPGNSVSSAGFKKKSTQPQNKGVLQRSAVKVPKINLDNTYGIQLQKANNKSAVAGPTSPTARPTSAQASLVKKAGKHVTG